MIARITHGARAARVLPLLLLAVVVAVASGCASFTNVRSAQVKQGFALSANWSNAAPLGPDASYMWTLHGEGPCDSCSRSVTSLDVSIRRGARAGNPKRAYELALGFTGVSDAYAEGFFGWNQDGRVPFGLGARATLLSGDEHFRGRDYRVDGRMDIRLIDQVRVMLASGVYYHRTSEPSWLLAYTPGAGLEATLGPLSLSSSIGWLLGEGRRTDSAARELGLQYVDVAVPVVTFGFSLHAGDAVQALIRQ